MLKYLASSKINNINYIIYVGLTRQCVPSVTENGSNCKSMEKLRETVSEYCRTPCATHCLDYFMKTEEISYG